MPPKKNLTLSSLVLVKEGQGLISVFENGGKDLFWCLKRMGYFYLTFVMRQGALPPPVPTYLCLGAMILITHHIRHSWAMNIITHDFRYHTFLGYKCDNRQFPTFLCKLHWSQMHNYSTFLDIFCIVFLT